MDYVTLIGWILTSTFRWTRGGVRHGWLKTPEMKRFYGSLTKF